MTAESATIAELAKVREEVRRMEIERESLITAANYWSDVAGNLKRVNEAQSQRIELLTAERDQLERTVERLQSVIANGVV